MFNQCHSLCLNTRALSTQFKVVRLQDVELSETQNCHKTIGLNLVKDDPHECEPLVHCLSHEEKNKGFPDNLSLSDGAAGVVQNCNGG